MDGNRKKYGFQVVALAMNIWSMQILFIVGLVIKMVYMMGGIDMIHLVQTIC